MEVRLLNTSAHLFGYVNYGIYRECFYCPTIIIHNCDSRIIINNLIPAIIGGKDDHERFLIFHQAVSVDIYRHTMGTIPCRGEEQRLREVSFIVIGISRKGNG
jgi:hypothetical protein